MPGLEGMLGYQLLGVEAQRGTVKAFLLGEDAAVSPLTQTSGLLIAEKFDYIFLCNPHTLEGGSETGITYLVLDKENNSTETKRPSALGITKEELSPMLVGSPHPVL